MNTESNNFLVLYDLEGKEKEKVPLNSDIFDGKVNIDLLHQIKLMYEASQRKGTASTKTRGEVKGGNRKPWRQKGTGRARMGSIRSPLWRGGGKVFGPMPRDYAYRLPKRILKRGLKDCLNMHWKASSLRLVEDNIKLENPKTKNFAKILEKLKLKGRILFVLKEVTPAIRLASRNIAGVVVKTDDEVNVMDILYSDLLILTPSALEGLILRINK
ncbi:MAG: 50S ribosomal protein L4 [Candidatus Omnitrophica bacterium]|nr:50S ribosomal protein L4 [Candidatus Omnitrophota bacterium]